MKFFIRDVSSFCQHEVGNIAEVIEWMVGKPMERYDLFRREENDGAGSQYVSWLDFHTEYKPTIEK